MHFNFPESLLASEKTYKKPHTDFKAVVGTPEATNYCVPPPGRSSGKRRKRYCFARLSPEVQEWRRQTVGLPKNVVMRGDDGTMVRGKFLPSQSGHTGPARRQNAHIIPNVATTEYNHSGTRASWVNAVMAGGIGAGPGLDPQYSHVGLQAGMDQARRQRRIKSKERCMAWKTFVGWRKKGAVSDEANAGCCVCSKMMWSCCRSLDESLGDMEG